jgi:RimJ/RimL family protein N-acetyltransferase
MIQIIKASLNDISPLRINYLNSLSEFQELYLELFINDSNIYQIHFNGIFIGYAIVTIDNILVEFYINDRFVSISSDVFETIVTDLSIQTIYCKSFDSLLLNCCLIKSYQYKLKGNLFRDYFDTDKISTNDLTIRFAGIKDYPFLLQQEGELYETPEELERFVNGNNIIMFQKDGQLLGCGYLIRVHANYNYYDIGMWVNPGYRKQGIATLIISYLKETCLTNNWKPICGCAIENIASRKTLEKNGFVSKHKLIEFICV